MLIFCRSAKHRFSRIGQGRDKQLYLPFYVLAIWRLFYNRIFWLKIEILRDTNTENVASWFLVALISSRWVRPPSNFKQSILSSHVPHLLHLLFVLDLKHIVQERPLPQATTTTSFNLYLISLCFTFHFNSFKKKKPSNSEEQHASKAWHFFGFLILYLLLTEIDVDRKRTRHNESCISTRYLEYMWSY